MNKLVIEKYSNSFRTQNGIGSRDPIRLKSLLSQLNVITIFRPLRENISGMAIKVNDGVEEVRFMLINSDHNIGKQNFTICHEMYHLFVQKDFTSIHCITGQFKKDSGEEYIADVFASILLLPEEGVKSLIPEKELAKDKISLKTILKIEHFFTCSRSALLYRLKELQLITSTGYDKYCQDVKWSAVKYGYSTDLYESGNSNLVIGNYGELARELFEKELISETHYISLLKELGMNGESLEKIINGEEE